MGTSGWELYSHSHSHSTSSDASLFSSSLPVLLAHEKLNHSELKHDLQSVDDSSPSLNDIGLGFKGKKFIADIGNHAVGSLLPDDEDELLAGIMDDFEVSWLPNLVDDSEENDFFGSGGGLELESDPHENFRVGVSTPSLYDNGAGNGEPHFNQTNGVGSIAGEHPLGEHPSRTLFVRNISSYVEDAELRALFELYGDIRTIYTPCKHRGFVMISYYDIRAARTAMRALQNKPLRRRKLDIHFSIPKENPSDKDINQGTLVVFNLDPSVSNDDILQIFGAYGEVKEIRETPHKRYHKFVEFYDIRAAEAALKSLNRSDIAGKRVKVEPSRPGGARRSTISSLLNLNPEHEKDERTLHKVGSPLGNSPPGAWPHLSSSNERNSVQNFSKSPVFSSLHASVGSSSSRRSTFEMSHSLPEQKLNQSTGTDYPIGASNFNETTAKPFSGPQLYWGSSELYSDQTSSPPITQAMRHPFVSGGNNGFPFSNHHGKFSNWSQIQQQYHHCHYGSAPSAVPLKQKIGFFQELPGALPTRPSCERVARSYMGDLSDYRYHHNITNAAVAAMKSISLGNASPVSSVMPSARPCPVFRGSGHFPGPAVSNLETLAERGRLRRFDTNEIQIDNRKQFQLDLDRIRTGEDTRTTLMIKNIPNKYTSKMLLAAIDEHHKGTYDFLYLPIDFKNKCNVGYAFINLLSPSNIIPFYEALNGKKWEKFNSEKVASLAYARIQGKAALVSHFQHTSLMNEDKRCRPILFDSEVESNDKNIQEYFSASDLSNGSNPGNFHVSAGTSDDGDQEKR